MTDPASTTQEISATLSGRIAKWVTALRYDDLPEEVVERTKLLILDQLGLQLLGATLPNVRPVLRLADAQPGKAEVTLAHSGTRTTVSQAAWVNGTLGHSAEYDDAHPLAWHTNSAVIPAAFALAEREAASGRDLITAVVAGIQVMGLLGAALPKMVTIGWHGSKVLGVYGAAAAAGRILGLTPAQLVNAFGIAGSDAGGGMEYDKSGGEVKRLHAGSASRSGLEAAELAQLGLTGPPTILEGPRGLLQLFGDGGDVAALGAVWDRWLVLDTIVRFYPSVATNHAPWTSSGSCAPSMTSSPPTLPGSGWGLSTSPWATVPASPGPRTPSRHSSASPSASACSSSPGSTHHRTTSMPDAGPPRRSSPSATWSSHTRCRSPTATPSSAQR